MSISSSNRTGYALFIIGVLFFIFGFVTWLNGTLIPFLKLACQLHTDLQAFFVTFAFYIAYFFLAIPSALILEKTGYKNGMALGLVVMALGSLVFVPAAQLRSFPLFLIGLFVQGTGLSLLQTASNPYISILGPLDSAAKRMSIMGICNKVAGVLSPLIVGAIVLKNASSLEGQIHAATDPTQKEALLSALAARVIVPYLVMAGILILLAIMIKASSLPEIQTEKSVGGASSEKTSVFQYPHLLLGVLCIFVYVGVEVLAGDGIGTFGKALGISLDKTKYFTTFTLAAMLVGYVIGIITIPRYLSQSTALRICAISGLAFSVGILTTTGYTAITFIALLGLSNSLMWPAIWPLALEGLGRFTKIASALLVMGIAGGALLPLLYGGLKDNAHVFNNLAYCICLIPCYAYILYFALGGHNVGKPVLVTA
ncbi:sugar MFS transporter [Dinghuibacter silviterrae]|uniref:Glucose/galactose transporter n=1 Tax=Dinghuibacter silviterrae TaxID=1539049 RepID=A0A4R8DUG0_9BACT|nr:sugar MFS transporter [Dinghuibacter silviterrae]TDX01095.1 glucose/galactose transporter [Dinghuibacter silviterrae]